jgi:hypothetical protein
MVSDHLQVLQRKTPSVFWISALEVLLAKTKRKIAVLMKGISSYVITVLFAFGKWICNSANIFQHACIGSRIWQDEYDRVICLLECFCFCVKLELSVYNLLFGCLIWCRNPKKGIMYFTVFVRLWPAEPLLLDLIYKASNNELVRPQTLLKNATILH